MGLIFLRCFLHPQQMGRANHIKVQILKKTIACKYDLTKNLNVLGTSWHTACQKVPWAMMIHSAKVTYIKKGWLVQVTSCFFYQHQTVDWPPKETFSTLIWNTWGCQFISPLSQTIFHLKTYQKIIILSKRVMSFNKPTTVNFSKPQHILLKRTHIHQCHTTFYVRAKSHFSLFSVLVQKDKKVIGQNSVDYRK